MPNRHNRAMPHPAFTQKVREHFFKNDDTNNYRLTVDYFDYISDSEHAAVIGWNAGLSAKKTADQWAEKVIHATS